MTLFLGFHTVPTWIVVIIETHKDSPILWHLLMHFTATTGASMLDPAPRVSLKVSENVCVCFVLCRERVSERGREGERERVFGFGFGV